MKALISLLFLFLVNSSFAQEMRYYDIEIVIIENLSEKEKASENWPLQVNLVQLEETVQLGEPVLSEWLPQDKDIDLKSSYIVLDSKDYQLMDEVEKITASTTHRVIYHTAWRQPGLDKNEALPIYFKHEVAPLVLDEETKQATQNFSLAQELNLELNSPAKTKPSPSILEGILRVTLSRYLHLEAELVFRNPPPVMIKSDNPFSILDHEQIQTDIEKRGVIYLKQKRRRIRSNELHYVDHPVLGMLIRITRYDDSTNKDK